MSSSLHYVVYANRRAQQFDHVDQALLAATILVHAGCSVEIDVVSVAESGEISVQGRGVENG